MMKKPTRNPKKFRRRINLADNKSIRRNTMTLMKYTLSAMLWMTSVTIDKQVMLTENGPEIAWSISLTASESLAVFENNY